MVETPRIAACQFEPTVGDVDANVDAIERTLASLPASVSVVVFPELCLTGYELDVVENQATTVPGSMTEELKSVATEHDVTVVVGVPERDGNDRYNSLVAVDRTGVRATYRKQYLWGDEADVFTPGDGPTTVDTDVGTLGFALCYDLNFPEVGLEYAREECDVLAVSAAWRVSYEADWRLLLRARALDGAYYVLGSNHTGEQRGRDHAGRSLVAGPSGTVLSEVMDGEGHAVVPVQDDRIETSRSRNPVRVSREWS